MYQDTDDTVEVLETHGFGAFVDPLEFLRDDPTFGFGVGFGVSPMALISDREGGKNRPVFETESELAIIRGQSRVLFDTTAVAQCAIDCLTNYILGTGFTYQMIERHAGSKLPAGLVDAVQHFVEEFLEEQDWPNDREREFLRRDRRDGEVILALFPQRSRMPVLRFAEPESLTEPTANIRILEDEYGDGNPQSWTFGVHTPENDVENVLGYYLQWDTVGRDWDYMPERLIVHSRRNVDRNIKRGFSDFYVVKGDMLDELKLRRNSRVGAAIQAAVAWVEEQAPNTTKAKLEGVVAGAATSLLHERTSGGSLRTRNVQNIKAGTIIKTAPGKKYHAGPLGVGTNNANLMLIAAYVLRSIGTRWNMPEYMISGDSSNANFASTLVAESPFVKARQHDQFVYMKLFREMIWKAIHIAFHNGMFRRFHLKWSDFKFMLKVDITAPEVASRKPLELAQKHQIELMNATVSRRTVAAETGREFDTEEQQRADDGDDDMLAASAPPPAAGLGGGIEASDDELRGEMQAGRRQGSANFKAIKDILREVADGDIREMVAVELLIGLGLHRQRAVTLVDDATGRTAAPAESTEQATARDIVDHCMLEIASRNGESWGAYP